MPTGSLVPWIGLSECRGVLKYQWSSKYTNISKKLTFLTIWFAHRYRTKNSRMDQVKFVEDSL